MNKAEFLTELEARLGGLPREDVRKAIDYYAEMIDERMEDGISEQEAVSAIGSVDEAVASVLGEIPLPALIREKMKPQRSLRLWEIVLIILGAPLWFSLLIAAASVVLSVYIVIWSVVVTVFAVDLSLLCTALAGLVTMVTSFASGQTATGVLMLSLFFLSVGLAILFFQLGIFATKGIYRLSKYIWIGIKRLFVGKEAAA